MAGASDIIAYGFGSWSTVAKVPTHGFGSADVVVPDLPGIEWTLERNYAHWRLQSNGTHWTLDKNAAHWIGED